MLICFVRGRIFWDRAISRAPLLSSNAVHLAGVKGEACITELRGKSDQRDDDAQGLRQGNIFALRRAERHFCLHFRCPEDWTVGIFDDRTGARARCGAIVLG
jgi:hypothetical protein